MFAFVTVSFESTVWVGLKRAERFVLEQPGRSPQRATQCRHRAPSQNPQPICPPIHHRRGQANRQGKSTSPARSDRVPRAMARNVKVSSQIFSSMVAIFWWTFRRVSVQMAPAYSLDCSGGSGAISVDGGRKPANGPRTWMENNSTNAGSTARSAGMLQSSRLSSPRSSVTGRLRCYSPKWRGLQARYRRTVGHRAFENACSLDRITSISSTIFSWRRALRLTAR